MNAWYWCPCCERTFRTEAPQSVRSLGNGLPATPSLYEPCPTDCPHEDCRAAARCVMPWASVRKWALLLGQQLPTIPVEGAYYATPVMVAQEEGAYGATPVLVAQEEGA
jgi:hypothetical protein